MKREEKSIDYHLERIKKLKKQYEEEYKKQTDLEIKSIPSKDVESFIERKTVMKREQTAVEWLVAKIKNNFGLVFSENITNEANEIFQGQIECAFLDGYGNGHSNGMMYDIDEDLHEIKLSDTKQYYQSTFGVSDLQSTNKTQTVSDRINARPRKRPLNITRKHEKREYHDLDKLTRFTFGPSDIIVRYDNDLLPRTIKIY